MMYNPQRTLVRLFGGKSSVQPVRLVRWQLLLCGLTALQAVVLLVLSTAYEVPVYVAHLTGDTLQTQLTGQATTAQALTKLFGVNLSYLLAAVLLITSLVALVLATLYRNQYVAMVKRGWQPLRWFTVAASGSLLLVALGLLAGVRDVSTLLLMIVSASTASALVIVLEQLPARRGQSRQLGRLIVATATILAVAPFMIILLTLISTNIFGSIPVAGYIWSMLGTVLVGAGLLGLNMYLTLRKRGKWANYAYGERWFVILVALIETAFVWQVFAATLHA